MKLFGGHTCTGCTPDDDSAAVELVYKSLACDRLRVRSQPIIDLSTRDVHAEELLVRIATDGGGLLLPENFVPAAERHGLMPRIDRVMVEHAAVLASCGRNVHVNLSGTTIADGTFFDDALDMVHRHGADPRKITFEITETAAASDMHSAGRLGTRLAKYGFGLAIDDLGSGWGAFRYLRTLPVGMIKIDREFVRDLCANPKATRLVHGMVALARAIGLKTVAEGVEDERTLAGLRAMGVNYAQGLHIGPPVPAELGLGPDARRRLVECGLLPV
jgi:EAL domain-containing protein (putative c-di-GMP-specific phosphodiesterase class I)